MKIKKILFPTDFSRCANQALSHAVFLAQHHQATLHILHALVLHESDPFYPAYNFPDSEDLNHRLEGIAISQIDKDLGAFDVSKTKLVKTQRCGISAAVAILDYIAEKNIDVVVMGTHGRRGLGHILLGSVAEEIVRIAPCPVFTIREQKNAKPIDRINKILVPIDFSIHSKNALNYAVKLAHIYQSGLQLLHVVEEKIHPSFYLSGKNSIFDFMPDIISMSTDYIQKMLQETQGARLQNEIHIVEGNPARDIIKFAEENETDLIVIATHGLTALEHFFLGSVTEKVVRRVSCPVFTVKSFGKSLI